MKPDADFQSTLPMRIAKVGYILFSIILCALGIIRVAVPQFSVETFSMLCGVVFIAFGCIRLVGFHAKVLYRLAFQYDFEFGILIIVLGVLTFLKPGSFTSYSDSNIREKTLLEALQSPLFMAYHDNQPFNCDHLRPCPMLENPEALERIVRESGACSTDIQSPESADHLCGKCQAYATAWAPVADELWKTSQKAKKEAGNR